MRTTLRTAALAAVIATSLVVVSAPAGAAPTVTVTTSGTTVAVGIDGAGDVALSCPGTTLLAAGVAARPAVPCSSITTIAIVADGAGQWVDADLLRRPLLPALTSIQVNLGAGDDTYVESTLPESVNMGAGIDDLRLWTIGEPNSIMQLGGTAGDRVQVLGRSGDGDTIIVATGHGGTASGAQTLIQATYGGSTRFHDVRGVRSMVLAGSDGHDILRANSVPATEDVHITSIQLLGRAGDDQLRASPRGSVLDGGLGRDSLVGSTGPDIVTSRHPADTITLGSGADSIWDVGPGRIGRTVTGAGTDDRWGFDLTGADVAVRTRNVATPAGLQVTTGLHRSGRQALPPVDIAYLGRPSSSGPATRHVFDLVPSTVTAQDVGSGPLSVVDITVPVGVTWTITGDSNSRTVTLSGGYQWFAVRGVALGQLVIHHPITDANRRFAWRVIRDAHMRVPTDAAVEALRARLASGTSRATVVAELFGHDTFRGIEVDRGFTSVLRRGTDAGGRGYWIGRLRDGLTLRRLRANLYGSDEYFATWGGGTRAEYVRSAYRDVLGRSAADSEVAYWVGVIEGGLPRGSVAERFSNTPESRQRIIEGHFLRWADRLPTSAELARWSPQVARTDTDGELALLRFLAVSSAYFTLA